MISDGQTAKRVSRTGQTTVEPRFEAIRRTRMQYGYHRGKYHMPDDSVSWLDSGTLYPIDVDA